MAALCLHVYYPSSVCIEMQVVGLDAFLRHSLSDFNNTIKLRAVDRQREGEQMGRGINYEKEVNIRYWYISHPN